MSEIIDGGSWLFAAGAVVVIALAFFSTVNERLETAYHVPNFNEYFQPTYDENEDEAGAKAAFDRGTAEFNAALANRQTIPLVGDRFFTFFSFEPGKFYQPLLSLSVFYVPAAILLMCVFGGAGSFGLVIRRDYGTLAVCSLSAWAAAHLPFAIVGILLYSQAVNPLVYLGLWVGSGLIFGVFMIFALRTVFGANYGVAVLVVAVAWLSMSLGMYIFGFVSPWMFSPFLIFYAVIYFGGFLGGEVRGFGNAFRQKQNLKRFLHNSTVNPNDADAHVQLGLIYLQRRQQTKAIEHLTKAFEIDGNEIDANYELGKLAREKGDLQTALDHFAVVAGQNDKHSLSEIWREIGATYLGANMLTEARDALEKYVERRSADVEGLYYFGKVLKAQGETARASEVFAEAVASAKASPTFKRRTTRHWSKLAQKEL
ncbi:MAG: hypothetical protein ABL999_01345 [Pyrinomonadaceae bacterium]